MIKRLLSRLTMIHDTNKMGFVDKVSGKLVKYWVDWNGHKWMATSRWSSRVKVERKN